MPLLHKQKFNRAPVPEKLKPDQEVFYSKLTQEIFLDYDDYFERTILCNSLVWTCALTGKTVLTYAEALESEKKAKKIISSFPAVLEKAIIFLITLTKRGNIKDLVEDIFSFTKDRYFIGENVSVTMPQSASSSKGEVHKACKILDVIIPGSEQANKNNSKHDSSFDEEKSKSIKGVNSYYSNGLLIDHTKIKYQIEQHSGGHATKQIVNANQLSRSKNLLIKDKIYIIIKLNCDVSANLIWTVNESVRSRLATMKYGDIFRGEPPHFETTYGRGQFSRNNMQKNAANDSPNNKSPNKKLPESKKKVVESKAKSSPQQQKNAKSSGKSVGKPASLNHKKTAGSDESEDEFDENDSDQAKKVVKVLAKKVCEMSKDDFQLWLDYKPEEDLKELYQIETEADKIMKREEKERMKVEKNKQREYLKELKKPKEDLELESMSTLPKSVPVQSKITQDMFGDAVMVLEFLSFFGELFDLRDDFPNGFNFDFLENALFSKSSDSALCNLLLFMLDSVFKCYDEETFEDAAVESENEAKDDEMNDSDDEEVSLERLYHEPVESAKDRESMAALANSFNKLVKGVHGRSLKNIGLDVFSISEMLRLYFVTSGATHHSKAKFWYQQRGGYTRMDETGIDFALNEKSILKKLESTSVFELEPNEKLKILNCLCHQLMSQVRFRDLMEDNLQKMSNLRMQLRDLQTEENKRVREENSEKWKRKVQEKAKEKARLEEIKTNLISTESNSSHPDLANDPEFKKLIDKKREEFLKKENKIQEEINQVQTKCCMFPLGKDRFYRRYWYFKSLPGLFVEDDNNNHELKTLLNDYLTNDDREAKWSFYNTVESVDALLSSLSERGLRESELKQNILEHKERIIESLSKLSIIKNLTLSENEVEKGIQEGILDTTWAVSQKVSKSGKCLPQPDGPLTSAEESLEANLNLKLLEIEEQIYAGSLGSLHINDREKWRESLLNNNFDPQCDQLTWADVTRPVNKEKNNKASNLSAALLQIEQSVERRFLRVPLGDCQKTPERKRAKSTKSHENHQSSDSEEKAAQSKSQTLLNWEKSLLQCSTYSQVFLHLQSLDESVAWSKSVLNACCRLCRRKGDADKMLLCDKCDCGHHIFCLRPPLNSIPDGEWFCPKCKPKEAERTPRKIRKAFSSVGLVDDIYSAESDAEVKSQNEDTNDAKSDSVSGKKRRRATSEEEASNESEHEDETEVEEDGEEAEGVDEEVKRPKKGGGRREKVAIESSVSSEEDDENDQDYDVNKKAKGEKKKANGKHVNGSSKDSVYSDEEETLAEETESEYEAAKRSSRKRKVVQEKLDAKTKKTKPVTTTTTKAKQIELSDFGFGRQTRTRTRPDYKEKSDDDDDAEEEEAEADDMDTGASETDDSTSKKNKRLKNTSNPSNAFANNTSSRNTEMGQRLKVTEKLLNDVMKHRDAWAFLKPVSKRDAPDYYEVIKKPMDFLTIKNNINYFKYDDYTNIIDDIRLVFKNCRVYNEPDSDVYESGERLSKFFETQAKQLGLLDTKHLASP